MGYIIPSVAKSTKLIPMFGTKRSIKIMVSVKANEATIENTEQLIKQCRINF